MNHAIHSTLLALLPWLAPPVALAAAIIDVRTGKIPNRLTLPVILAAVVACATLGGVGAVATSLLGGLLSGLVPVILYQVTRKRGIGGGDVKLFAAIGCLAGPSLGLEIQFASFVLLGVIAVTRLAYQGGLTHLLISTGFVLINPMLPKRKRRPLEAATLTEMRMGPAIFLGTLLGVVAGRMGGVSWLG